MLKKLMMTTALGGLMMGAAFAQAVDTKPIELSGRQVAASGDSSGIASGDGSGIDRGRRLGAVRQQPEAGSVARVEVQGH